MALSRLKSVPYSKQLRPVDLDQDFRLVHVYFGSRAWDASKDLGPLNLVLPPFEPSEQYDWRPVSGCFVVGQELGVSEPIYRQRLAFELLKAGATEVLLMLSTKTDIAGTGALQYLWEHVPHERYTRSR